MPIFPFQIGLPAPQLLQVRKMAPAWYHEDCDNSVREKLETLAGVRSKKLSPWPDPENILLPHIPLLLHLGVGGYTEGRKLFGKDDAMVDIQACFM